MVSTLSYPSEVKDNPYSPPIVITEFRLFNDLVEAGANSILSQTIENTDQIELSHRDDFLELKLLLCTILRKKKISMRISWKGWMRIGIMLVHVVCQIYECATG